MSPTTQHAFEPQEVMAYLDGELEPRRAAALATHLDHCAECQALTSQFRTLTERLLSYQMEPPPISVSESVTAAIADHRSELTQGHETRGAKTRLKFSALHVRPWARPWAWGLAGVLAVAMIWLSSGKYNQSISRGRPDTSRLLTSQQVPIAPPPGGNRKGRVTEGQSLYTDQYSASAGTASEDGEEQPDKADKSEPMIARTASLSIIVKEFGTVQSAVKRITERYKGYLGQLSTTAPQDAARTLNATLRIPSPQLEAALAELKQLGRVEQESQSGDEVTKEYTDLAARLKNSRATEQRLLDVLRKNTGKVKEVLEVETEISRVRGEIEQMEADQRALKTRVDFATLQLSLTEDFKASLHVTPPSTMTRLHNAVVQGYRDVVESVIGLAVWLLEAGPTLLLWAAVLFFPARWIWKRWLRERFVKSSAASAA